jgi:hypothetical protein
MNATSALLQANHRITELQAEARQARLAAEVRRSGQGAGRTSLTRRLVRAAGRLLHRSHRHGQILAT